MTIGYNRYLEVRPSKGIPWQSSCEATWPLWSQEACPTLTCTAGCTSLSSDTTLPSAQAMCLTGQSQHSLDTMHDHARPCTQQWPGQGGVQNRTQCVISHTGQIGYAFLLSWTSPSQSKVFADQFHLPQPNVFIIENTSLWLPDTSFISKCPVRLHSDSQGELFYRLFYRAGPTSCIC